jgi:hypothetical protein
MRTLFYNLYSILEIYKMDKMLAHLKKMLTHFEKMLAHFEKMLAYHLLY